MKFDLKYFGIGLLVMFCLSCNDEPLPDPIEETCDFEMGPFKLLEKTLEILPYAGKHEMQFSNESGFETKFTVRGGRVLEVDEKIIIENDIAGGDPIEYCFLTQKSEFILEGNELGVIFEISLTTRPFESALTAGFLGDVLDIYYAPNNNPNEATKVFTKTINQRTFPQPLTSDFVLDTMNIWGVDFYNLEFMNLPGAHTSLLYNDEIGVVGFQDENAIFWRVDWIR